MTLQATPPRTEAALPAPPAGAMPGVAEAVESWRMRLAAAGVACRTAAVASADGTWQQDLHDVPADYLDRWRTLRHHVTPGTPVTLWKPDAQPGAELLLVTAMQLPDGSAGSVGAVLAPPHNERTVQLVLLSLGWLQLALAAPRLALSQRAARLLELLGHVASQDRARAGAQEWINRSAAWLREELPPDAAPFSLALFDVRGSLPRWWVAADTAWAEKGSPQLAAATELAAQAAAAQQEIHAGASWALPVLDDGHAVAVLVLSAEGSTDSAVPPQAAPLLRASLDLAEPLLRRWREAERPLWRHHLDALGYAWRRIREPGWPVWRAGAAAAVIALAVLLLWPVPDRVTAHTVIEGRLRQVVTAPFDGFIGRVLVRPGAQVQRGQLLLQMDERELRLEQARFRSEREQAAGRLRQAMAEREASAMALAMAEVQQAEAQLALVDAKLARAGLAAPLDGLVVNGDWVQQIGGPVEIGKELFEIASGEGFRVVLHVADRDIARVRVGQAGTLRLTGQPQAAHAFQVSNVTATASVQDGVNGFRVEADWQGEVPRLSPGMQGIGKVEVGRSNLLTIWTRSSVDWLRLKLWSWWW